MNPYSVMVAPHPLGKRHGWIVVVEWSTADTFRGRRKGDKRARRYHYKKDADECANVALRDIDECPEFYEYGEVAGD